MTIVIGITGSSGSGKTTLANYLQKIFDEDSVVISLDWFYKEVSSDGETYDWDSPAAFDFQRLREVVEQLIKGEPAFVPGHDYSTYKKIENMKKIEPRGIIIIEGIMALHDPEIRKLYDKTVFINCDDDVCLGRRVIRDVEKRGYQIKFIVDRYFKFVKPAYKKYILPLMSNVDLIINNSKDNSESNFTAELATLCAELALLRDNEK